MLEKIVYEMPEFYKAELHKKCQNEKHKNTLIISFSPNADHFALYKYIDSFNVLYFSCEPSVYYLASVEKICDFIQNLIIENSYTNIVLIGTSKGGFASCLYGILLAKKCENLKFTSLVFSAQLSLYPKNKFVLENSKISCDYQPLLNCAEQNNEILNNLKKYGNIKELLNKKIENLKIHAIAGKNEIVDSKETQNLSACQNVEITLLELSSHFTLIPFTLNLKDIENFKKFKNFLKLTTPDYFNLKQDENSLNKIADEIAELVKNGNLLSLNEIFGILADGNELVSLTKNK